MAENPTEEERKDWARETKIAMEKGARAAGRGIAGGLDYTAKRLHEISKEPTGQPTQKNPRYLCPSCLTRFKRHRLRKMTQEDEGFFGGKAGDYTCDVCGGEFEAETIEEPQQNPRIHTKGTGEYDREKLDDEIDHIDVLYDQFWMEKLRRDENMEENQTMLPLIHLKREDGTEGLFWVDQRLNEIRCFDDIDERIDFDDQFGLDDFIADYGEFVDKRSRDVYATKFKIALENPLIREAHRMAEEERKKGLRARVMPIAGGEYGVFVDGKREVRMRVPKVKAAKRIKVKRTQIRKPRATTVAPKIELPKFEIPKFPTALPEYREPAPPVEARPAPAPRPSAIGEEDLATKIIDAIKAAVPTHEDE